jgi:phage tail sheath protein FI
VTNGDNGAEELRPFSPIFAGIVSRTDFRRGFFKSPSNEQMLGVVRPEINITWDPADASTEANALNAVGIVTYGVPFGGGDITWGNRSASHPSSTDQSNFISVQRVADILHESLELAMLNYLDGPINNALIDAVRGAVNALIRSFVQSGALIDGECTYDPNDNPAEDVAAGKLKFNLAFMPPPPAERITFESTIDITILEQLGQGE